MGRKNEGGAEGIAIMYKILKELAQFSKDRLFFQTLVIKYSTFGIPLLYFGE